MKDRKVTRFSGSRLNKLRALCISAIALATIEDKETAGLKVMINRRIDRHDIKEAFRVTEYDAHGKPVEEKIYDASDFFSNVLDELLAKADKFTMRKFTGVFSCASRLTMPDGSLVVIEFNKA